MKKILLFIGLGVLLSLQSCYDDYKTDYTYSATYFARQYPLRTLLATNDDDLTFEVGVVIAGKRLENLGNEEVSFRLAPELIDSLAASNPEIKLLPEDYYTMSNDEEFDILKGEGTRLTTMITLDKDKFVNDSLSILPVYALPLEIDSYSTDSVLEGKEFTIVLLRYYNEYHGDYFVRGVDYALDGAGMPTDTFRYGREDDIVKSDWTNEFVTESFDVNTINYIGRNNSTTSKSYIMNVKVGEDGLCLLSGNETSVFDVVNGSAEYDTQTRQFVLEYTYSDNGGVMHEAYDTAYYLNTEFVDESWK